MGYRSDVAIAIYGEADQMAAFIAASRLKADIKSVFGECEIYPYSYQPYGNAPSKPHIMLTAQFSDVKWYDGYSDVDCWMRFVGLAQEQDGSINTEFVRIGEDTTDTVCEQVGADCEYHLSIRREVSTLLPPADTDVKTLAQTAIRMDEANEATAVT